MGRFILDTNALISIIEKKNPKILKNLNEAVLRQDEISITILNYYELLRGASATTNAKYGVYLKKYLNEVITVISKISQRDAQSAAGIYQKIRKKINEKKTTPSDVDIIMAAIALSMDATIVSHDDDFHLMGVKVQNWES